MSGQIVLLVVGFVLTTVVGGFLSYLYQLRRADWARARGEADESLERVWDR